MTVRELFGATDTDNRRIIIYDYDKNVLWNKHSFVPVGKCDFLDFNIAWIYFINSEEICIRLEYIGE